MMLGWSLESECRFSRVVPNITNFVGNVKFLPQIFLFLPKIFNFEAEIRFFEEEAGAADSELVKGGTVAWRGEGGGGGGEEIGDDGGDGVGALGYTT
ncbi:hypothetical protein Vadar_026738 [Vaccinium darrowii]|uniref:Uncharacterized protein n=1 Tax=Vaccinium darrowii TaxID=229202 RepID=A0ACB7YS12_9ERIC|nr:hypothetical protein Vadar_026738 [Vaccinium darrowii]